MLIRRLTKNALLLALLCIGSMLSISLGNDIKVSLQTFILFLIFLLSPKLIDKLIITISYTLLGFIIPIYAGFSVGISPTFGYIIGFIFSSFVFHLLMNIKHLNIYVKIVLASISSLLLIYLCGTIFMSIYLNISFINCLLISVVPYIIFDVLKIILLIGSYAAIKPLRLGER